MKNYFCMDITQKKYKYKYMIDNDDTILAEAYSSILTEMPINSFNLKGEWDKDSKPRGYDKASRGILTSEKGVEKIKNLWNKIPVDVDIYMVSSKHGWKHTEVGKVDPVFILDELKLDIPIDNDNTTIFYTNNKGSEKVPTTAWTLAHRFGHALRRTPNYQGNYEYTMIEKEVARLVSSVGSMLYNILHRIDSHDYSPINRINKREIANALGTFKSARDRKLRNYEEFTNELIAQYIITGKIEFNREFPRILPTSFAWGNPNGPYKQKMNDDVAEDFEYIITQAENDIYNSIEQLIYSSVGSVYVM